MRNIKKICTGTAVLAGAVGTVLKLTAHCRKNWFARGYLVGFTDGALDMTALSHEVADTAEKIAQHNTELVRKYDALCADYEALERQYEEMGEENED